MNKDEIVTLVLINGAEVIGKWEESDSDKYIINRPRMVQANQQGVGLVNGVCMTGEEPKGDVAFNRSGVIFVIKTVEQLATQYQNMTSSIIIPKSKGLLQ